jgi:glycosyltransferase involved in cell wall biosynthesis
MEKIQPIVSVIVTIYNCERYFSRCISSLFEQTLDAIEYIFVNDATTDNSMRILDTFIKDYPCRKTGVRVINIKTNAGVANARQIGISQATGEYIIHADSDDWVDRNMYETLYLKAKETEADIVGCNFIHEFPDVQYDFHQQYTNHMDENIRRLINGKIFPSLCTSLTRRSLITNHNISFPKGLNMGEDLFFNLQLYLHAKKIIGMEWAPYHYRHTADSSCVQRTRKSIDSDIAIAGLIEKLMKEKGLYEKYHKDIAYRKFFSKLQLMQDLNNKEYFEEWLKIFPETNKYIWQYDQIDWKQKLRLWFAANGMLPAAKAFQQLLELQYKIRHL